MCRRDDYPPYPTTEEIAAENGVSPDALRAALRESHPDASPSEVIGRARSIESRSRRVSIPRGHCRWCLHPRRLHDGRVDPAVRKDPTYRNVRWTTTACSLMGCACRTYEV